VKFSSRCYKYAGAFWNEMVLLNGLVVKFCIALENSPAFQGWVLVPHHKSSPGRDGRTALSSQTGLKKKFQPIAPALKGWAIFKTPAAGIQLR